MLRFSANISMLFTELPLLERPAAAAAAGFKAIEIQFPYDVEAEQLASSCKAAGVETALFNLPGGKLDAGELGIACLPGREKEFASGVDQAIRYAETLDCTSVNCIAGLVPERVEHDDCWPVLIANARYAASRLEASGLKLLIEPINRLDRPRFVLSGLEEADMLLEDVDHPNLALQYDVYHMRADDEDWLAGLMERLGHVGHIQFADFPGRHEPGSGDMELSALFNMLPYLPYDGWVGAEYIPGSTTAASLDWFRPYRER